MTAFLRLDQLPTLAVVPDDALLAVETAGKLWAAPRSAVGGGAVGSGFYQTLQNNGTNLTQRAVLNVTGLLTAVDSGGKTVLNLAAINLASQVTGVLPIANGGTGLSAPGTTGQSLRYNSGGLLEAYTPSAGLNAPASPGDNNKVAVASSGNLSYALLTTTNLSASANIALTQLASMSAARLLGRDSGSGTPVELTVGGGLDFTGSGGIERSALTGAISAAAGSGTTAYASGDFGSLALKSTSSLTLLTNAPVLQLGLAPGSGAGSAAATGDIRLRNNVAGLGPSCMVRNNADGADVYLWGYDGTTNGLQLGNAGGGLSLIDARATTVQVRGTTTVVLGAGSTNIRMDAVLLQFNDTSVNPKIGFAPTVTATGQKLTIAGQQAATTGGALDIAPGFGVAGPGGLGRLVTGALTARFQWNDTGVGFFATAPVSQRTLTDSTGGTPATSLVDVGVVFNQANINNNFASLRQLLNQYGLAA